MVVVKVGVEGVEEGKCQVSFCPASSCLVSDGNWVGPGNNASVFQYSHHKLSTRLLLSFLSPVHPETSSGAGPEGMLKLLKVSVARKTVSE